MGTPGGPISNLGLIPIMALADQMTVASSRIVKRLDVVRDVGDSELPRLVNRPPYPCLLQTTEEGQYGSIVPAIAFAAHAWL